MKQGGNDVKNKDYIHEEYPKACRFCETGRFSFDKTAVLCPRRGIMSPEDYCRRFVYDPLKHTPLTAPVMSYSFKPEDFSL